MFGTVQTLNEDHGYEMEIGRDGSVEWHASSYIPFDAEFSADEEKPNRSLYVWRTIVEKSGTRR